MADIPFATHHNQFFSEPPMPTHNQLISDPPTFGETHIGYLQSDENVVHFTRQWGDIFQVWRVKG